MERYFFGDTGAINSRKATPLGGRCSVSPRFSHSHTTTIAKPSEFLDGLTKVRVTVILLRPRRTISIYLSIYLSFHRTPA